MSPANANPIRGLVRLLMGQDRKYGTARATLLAKPQPAMAAFTLIRAYALRILKVALW